MANTIIYNIYIVPGDFAGVPARVVPCLLDIT